ncbi:hypothetical protein DdX_19384 [Ditylenchus destructor]|uniref:Uncharacterized protein n=1 Tax=Ditylenchus destructor TaxID=166010 RepID=A0AAD4QXG0_9BILA|nr:hypothetical protein DdX_19384 [Ditylenchus destructor]
MPLYPLLRFFASIPISSMPLEIPLISVAACDSSLYTSLRITIFRLQSKPPPFTLPFHARHHCFVSRIVLILPISGPFIENEFVKNSECGLEFMKKISEIGNGTTLEKWCSILLDLVKCTYQLFIDNCGVEEANKAIEEMKKDQLNSLDYSIPECKEFAKYLISAEKSNASETPSVHVQTVETTTVYDTASTTEINV